MSALSGAKSIGFARERNVWAYLVVSSDLQAETLAHQKEWARQQAAEKHWDITVTFDGVSTGKDGVRGILEQLLIRLRKTPLAERPSRVLMTRLDRLGRGLGLEAMGALAEITRLGVLIHTRQDGDYNLLRASDSILPTMRIITGAIENEARRDKATAVFKRKRDAGLVAATKRPYGLKLHDGRDVADPERAAVVIKAFDLAANGFGLNAIGRRIAEFAPSQRFQNGREHNVDWINSRVAKMLRNPAYRCSIVPPEIWDRVQAFRSQAPTTRKSSLNPWPLSGALSCACGRRLIGTARGRGQRAYRCDTRVIHGRIVTHSARKIEEQFRGLLTRLSASPELIASYAALPLDENDTQVLLRQAGELAKDELRLRGEKQRIWDLNQRGKLRDDDLQERLDSTNAKLNEVQSRSASIRQKQAVASTTIAYRAEAHQIIKSAVRLWDGASVEQRQQISQAVASALGGLTVGLEGILTVGKPTNRKMFFSERPKPKELSGDL